MTKILTQDDKRELANWIIGKAIMTKAQAINWDEFVAACEVIVRDCRGGK